MAKSITGQLHRMQHKHAQVQAQQACTCKDRASPRANPACSGGPPGGRHPPDHHRNAPAAPGCRQCKHAVQSCPIVERLGQRQRQRQTSRCWRPTMAMALVRTTSRVWSVSSAATGRDSARTFVSPGQPPARPRCAQRQCHCPGQKPQPDHHDALAPQAVGRSAKGQLQQAPASGP